MIDSRCPRTEELLRQLLEEETVPVASPEVLQHCQTCPSCRKALEEIQSMEGQLAQLRIAIQKRFAPLTIDSVRERFAVPQLPLSPSSRTTSPPAMVTLRFSLAWVASLAVVVGLLVWGGRTWSGRPGQSERSSARRLINEGIWVLRQGTVVDASGRSIGTISGPLALHADYQASGTIMLQSVHGVEIEGKAVTFRLVDSEIRLRQGQIIVRVPAGGQIRFSVSTPVAVLGVRGTVFSVACQSTGEMQLEVTEGCVEVATVTGFATLVKAGQRLGVDAAGFPRSEGKSGAVSVSDNPASGASSGNSQPSGQSLTTIEEVLHE